MRSNSNWLARSFALCVVVALSIPAMAQAPAAPPQRTSAAPPAAGNCVDCGVVRSVRAVEKNGQASGVGAVAGGVLGGVIGHQFGSGRGNTAATIAGAGAGAYAGHQVEKNRNTKTSWSVSVRMDNGTSRNFSYANKPDFREGDRVKALDGGRRLALVAP